MESIIRLYELKKYRSQKDQEPIEEIFA